MLRPDDLSHGWLGRARAGRLASSKRTGKARPGNSAGGGGAGPPIAVSAHPRAGRQHRRRREDSPGRRQDNLRAARF